MNCDRNNFTTRERSSRLYNVVIHFCPWFNLTFPLSLYLIKSDNEYKTNDKNMSFVLASEAQLLNWSIWMRYLILSHNFVINCQRKLANTQL